MVLLGTLTGLIVSETGRRVAMWKNSAATDAKDAGWGRMTVYPAVESPGKRKLCETRFGGRTSKKIRRRVERNPV